MAGVIIPTTVLTNLARSILLEEVARANPEALARVVETAALRILTEHMPNAPETAAAVIGAVLEPLLPQLVKVREVRLIGGAWFYGEVTGRAG